MKKLLLSLVALVPAVASSVALAQPAASNVSISGRVDYITSNVLAVGVTVTCEGGTGTVTVTVQQARAPLPPATGTGNEAVICDGAQRKYAVDVVGSGYNLGDAVASATLTALSGTDTDTKNVRITRP